MLGLGPALLLVNEVLKNSSYANALELQLNHLLYDVPRDSATGGISHREDMVQFWADFVSMAPPFIAAYGLSLGDTTDGYNLLIEAHKQCQAYRTVLLDTRCACARSLSLCSLIITQCEPLEAYYARYLDIASALGHWYVVLRSIEACNLTLRRKRLGRVWHDASIGDPRQVPAKCPAVVAEGGLSQLGW